MGDRANVAIEQYDGTAVYLYTHWGGSELPLTVRAALLKKWRWDDTQYLARIIFDHMVGKQQGSETGFGIGTSIGDNEYPIVFVDPSKSTIGFAREKPSRGNGKHDFDEPYVTWSFADYIKLSDEEILAQFK